MRPRGLPVLRLPSVGPFAREFLAAALCLALVGAGAGLLRGFWPGEIAAAGVVAAAVLLCAALLWRTVRRLLHVLLAPYSGRLLRAVELAHQELSWASDLQSVARVVLRAMRKATGSPDAQPILQLFDPPQTFELDAAGQPHMRRHALPPAIEQRLREEPLSPIVRAPLEAQIVRAPALRPLIEALCGLDALCAMPLALHAELEAALIVPRAARKSRLTPEELSALHGLALHVAGFLAVLAATARAQERATAAFAAAQRAEQARVYAEQMLQVLSAETRALRAGGSAERPSQAQVAYSPSMRALLGRLCALADSDTPVWLIAERGVEIEPILRLLHTGSSRAGQALIIADCTAVPENETLMALRGRCEPRTPGWLELAACGTLCLRDVSALAKVAQNALLDAMTTHRSQPIDSDTAYGTRARMVVSSRFAPETLRTEGALEGTLRERFPVVLRVPPLRERAEDIPSLLLIALDRSARMLGRAPLGLDPSVQNALLTYDWPGNSAELDHVIEQVVMRARGSRVTLSDLRALGHARLGVQSDLDGPLEGVERRALERALERAEGNKSEAARLLGLKRSTFFDKLRRHGIADEEEDSSASN